MKKFGLIGYPISHSLSPALFKAAYNGKYIYDLIEIEDFETAYLKFLDEYAVINVTAPFKESAFRKADIVSEECSAIGATNILMKTDDGKIMACNSDYLGVSGAISDNITPEMKVRKVALIIGCGGAAKAAAYATCKDGYRTIIINRSFEKAQEFAGSLRNMCGCDVEAKSMSEFCRYFREAGVIVYTLPLHIPALSQLSEDDIKGVPAAAKILLEANYKDPSFSKEDIEKLRKINPDLVYVHGKEWLLHQAVGAYKSFTGEEPNIENMRKVL
jgi:shikimate 5-dehydrogenase